VCTQDEAKSAFDEWLKVKREQQKKEAKSEQEHREKEAQPETKRRSKREAERAFKKYADISTNFTILFLNFHSDNCNHFTIVLLLLLVVCPRKGFRHQSQISACCSTLCHHFLVLICISRISFSNVSPCIKCPTHVACHSLNKLLPLCFL